MIKTALVLALCIAVAHTAAPSSTGFYTLNKDYGMGFNYLWSLQFVPTMKIPMNTSAIEIGYVNFCTQTTGSTAVGPFSCKLNYMYDTTNDKFHFMTGQCDADIAHKYTDMVIKGMTFDSAKDAVTISFTSHAPTAGDFVLPKADASVIANCPAPTNVAPFEYCPKASFMEMMSVLA